MARVARLLSVLGALALVSVVLVATPALALAVDRAELRGNELRLEGTDAVANADITVDGTVLGSANGGGDFDIRVSPFSSPTCVISVSDGVETQSVTLDRCTPSAGNQDPTANAGPDQTVTDADGNGTETVTLDGSGSSDPEGPIVSFSWTEGATSHGTAASVSPVLTVGSHTITLTVTDGDGATASDVVVVTVDPAPPVNQPPTADAGPDVTLTDADANGTETVTLDGSASADPEGQPLTFQWTEGATSHGTAASVSPALTVGSHTITLTVTDGDGATASDVVVVTVVAGGGGNIAPVANAGTDQTITDVGGDGVETVTLDGSASTDSDGVIVSYVWSENGTPLGEAAEPPGGTAEPPGGEPSAAVGGTFDHLFESNQPDPPGIVPNSFGGSAASAGDVNGDGFGDIIIGSEVWDAGTEFAEGAAMVFLGSATGPVGNNPSNANALIEMNQAGATVNDVSTAGDVNGDGFDDVLVGSHFYDSVLPGTQLGVDGAVFVFHGGPSGITATGPADADGAIFANQILSGMGNQVDSAGDVNGDGFDDIVVSVPREGTLFPDPIPANDRSGEYGAILVFHGGPNGITGTGFADADTVILPYEDTGLPLPPVDASVSYGAGAGDINGDGFSDIVVGGSEVTTYFGGPNGIVAEDIFDANDRIFGDPLGGFLVDGAGDLNGDGFADITVGAPLRDLNPNTVPVEEGAAYVFLGGPTGLGATSVTQADTTILGTITGERVGITVAGPGDIDADGFDDWVVGAVHYAGSLDSEGVAYIYRGSAQGITATTIAEADSRLEAIQSGAVRLGNLYGIDAQGAGDVDNDGFIDVIVGKAFYDNGELNEGAAFLYNGEPFPANPNTPPVPNAGVDQQVVDVDLDGVITVSVDGSASFDPDGSIVSYEWYQAANNGATGEIFLATGPTATFELPFISPIPAWGHIVTLVVTDDQGTRRGDTVNVFPQLAPTTFEFAEWLDLSAWSTTGDVTLGDTGAPTPSPPHVLLRGNATLSRTFTPPVGTTGLDITYWARGDAFGPSDVVNVQASFDGGPFIDYHSFNPADAVGSFTFYGGSAFPISLSWWPSEASSVTLRFESNLSAGADFWVAALRVDSIQAPTAGATNQLPISDPGPDRTVFDADANGSELVTLDGTASFDPDGTIVAYEWRDGPVTIGTSAVITQTFPLGSHPLTLIVTDNFGDSTVGSVVITVADTPPPGSGPTLDVDLAVGTHVITLTVTDDQGATSQDTVQVIVQSPAANQPPVADAGPDQTVQAGAGGTQIVTLDGAGSTDPDGTVTTFDWLQDGVPLANGNDPIVTVTLAPGTYTFTLNIADNEAATATDDVVVTVEPANAAPTANAGPDQTVGDTDNTGQELVSLDGSASSDPEGPIASYVWSLGGVQVAAGVAPDVPLGVGAHTITLTVTDGDGATASDDVVITVDPFDPATNQLPIANAGPDQTVIDTDGNTLEVVTFDGTASFDPDGTIVAYNWTLNGNPFGNAATFSVTRPLGTFVVTLTVTDNLGGTASDDVVVTVEAPPAPGNTPPTAVAGPDLNLSDPDGDGLASAVVDGTGSTDPEGPIASYEWRLNGTLVGTGATQGIPFPVGVNTLELTVRDSDDAVGTDTAIVTVAPNGAPTAVAGPDQTVVDSDGDGSALVSVSAAGSSDADGTVAFWAWREGANVLATTEAASLDLAVGVHTIELTVTDNGGAEGTDTLVVTVNEAPPGGGTETVFVSSTSGGTVGGVSFADEDILAFDTSTGSWSLFLDGSDVGLSGAGARDVDAFSVLDDGSVLLSIVSASTLPDVGAIDDSDIVRFVPTSTGTTTAGTFEMYFDGSDVDLTSNGEDVDAIAVLANGDLLISTSGSPSIGGVGGLADEDVIRFTPTSLGATTAGTWAAYFDGSDVALDTASSEDIHGVWADANGDLYLTTRGTFAVSGVSGAGDDVFTCAAHIVGAATSCASHSLFFDGAASGFGGENLDGIHVTRN